MVDAKNGFNELGRKAMLWTVHLRWPRGAQFIQNCCCHSAQLILRHPGQPCHILCSKEGVTQGDPLSMVACGLGLLPLAEQLRMEVPDLLQPWCADDSAMAGSTRSIAKAMDLLLVLSPTQGHHPEPSKSIYLMRTGSEGDTSAELGQFKFQFIRGSCYVSGFLGSTKSLLE